MATGSNTPTNARMIAGGVPPAVKKDRHIVSWSPQEDDLLREQIAHHGTENWTRIAAQFKDKTSRQCRRRWYTYLNTECKKGGWSAEEDMLLCEAQKILGNRWTEIAKVVSGRTDNAVKNRFSTLCKKRAKFEASFKENESSHLNSSNKRDITQRGSTTFLARDSLASNKQIRYHISDVKENVPGPKRLLGEHQILEGHLRQPLKPVVQNFDTAGCLSGDSKKKVCNENQCTFLKKDDPKLTALLQQSELLTSLAMRINSNNTDQCLDEVWKELQDFLIQTEEGRSLRLKFAGRDQLLEELKDYVTHLRSTSMDEQHSLRQLDSQEDTEQRVACGKHSEPLMNAGEKSVCQFDVLSINEDSEGFLSSGKLNDNNENACDIANLDFASPLQTIPPFQSFTDGNPSPAFTSSERHFLLSVLDVSSPETKSSIAKQPSCKRVLLDSLPPP